MYSTTFKFKIKGSNYQEIVDKTSKEICSFLNVEVGELSKYANYEIDIEKDEQKQYNALVAVRIKNV